MNPEYIEKIGHAPNSRGLLEAEVLSACLIRPEWFEMVDLQDGDFELIEHRKMYLAMAELSANGIPLESVEVWKKSGNTP